MKRLLTFFLLASPCFASHDYSGAYLHPNIPATKEVEIADPGQVNTFCASNLSCTVSAAWTFTGTLNANGQVNSATGTGTSGTWGNVYKIGRDTNVAWKYPCTQAGLTSGIADAIAGTNGIAAGNILDATDCRAPAAFTSQVAIGNLAQTPTIFNMASPGTWTWNVTDGVSCGFKLFGNTVLKGLQQGGSNQTTLQPNAAGTNMDSLLCTDTTQTNYMFMEGFQLYNNIGATFANGLFNASRLADNFTINRTVFANYSGVGLFLRNSCCGGWVNGVWNGNQGAGAIPMKVGDGTNGVQAVTFSGSWGHPGAGLNNILFTGGTGAANVHGNTMLTPYFETNNAASNATPIIQFNGEGGLAILGGETLNLSTNASAAVIDISNNNNNIWILGHKIGNSAGASLAASYKAVADHHLGISIPIDAAGYFNYFSGASPMTFGPGIAFAEITPGLITTPGANFDFLFGASSTSGNCLIHRVCSSLNNGANDTLTQNNTTDTLTNKTLNTPLPSGTGLQIFNTTTTCTTAASVGATCTTAAISLPVAEADTSYRVVATCKGPTAVPVVSSTANSSATQFTITIAALTAVAASCGSFDVIAGHN